MIRIIIVMILIILIVANIMIIVDQTPWNHDHCRALDNHHSGHATPEQLLSCWSNQMPQVISSRPDSCIIITAAYIIIIIFVVKWMTMMMIMQITKEGVLVVMMTDVDNDMEKTWLQWPMQGLMESYFFGQSIHNPHFPRDLLSSCLFQQCWCALL